MNINCKVGIDISKTDNGYVLEWKDETKEDVGAMYIRDKVRPTRGIEVFTDKDKLIARIKQFL